MAYDPWSYSGLFDTDSGLNRIRFTEDNLGNLESIDFLRNGMDYYNSPTYNNDINNGLNMNMKDWLGIAGLAGTLGSGLLNYFNGVQQNNIARDMLKFQKNLANRNIANQAKVINNTYDNAAQVTAGMMGNNGLVDQATVDRMKRKAESQYVNGSAL